VPTTNAELFHLFCHINVYSIDTETNVSLHCRSDFSGVFDTEEVPLLTNMSSKTCGLFIEYVRNGFRVIIRDLGMVDV
jgi:hypothetical protein